MHYRYAHVNVEATPSMYLQVLFPVIGDLLRFDLSVLDVDLIPTQHRGYTLTHVLQVSMPYWDIVVGRSGCYIKHDDGTLRLDVVAVSQASEFLLASCVPYVELDGSPASVEHYGVNLNANRGCMNNL